MKRDNHITIHGWMIIDYDLKGNELITYALINGFSQDGESQFKGSQSYISEWINASRPTSNKVIKSLVEKGLIEKEDIIINSVIHCRYKSLHPVKKVNRGCKESLQGGVKKVNKGCKESLHINNSINNSTNNINNLFVEESDLEAFNLWIKYKKEKKQTYKSESSLRILYKKMKELSKGDPGRLMKIVEQSIGNNWAGLFDLKESQASLFQTNGQTGSDVSDYNDEVL